MSFFSSIRVKVFFGLFLLQFVALSATGYMLFSIAKNEYFRKFQNHVLSNVKNVALTLNADEHDRIARGDIEGSESYRQYMEYFRKVKESEPYITYLYSVRYDPHDDTLVYVLDGNVFSNDTVWVESAQFGLFFEVMNDGSLVVHYNSEVYSRDFQMDSMGKTLPVSITQDHTHPVLTIGSDFKIEILQLHPLQIRALGEQIDTESHGKKLEWKFGDVDCPTDINITEAGKAISVPGEEYVSDLEDIQNLKKFIKANQHAVDPSPGWTNFGEVLHGYGMIQDENGGVHGAVVAEVYTKELQAFRASIERTIVIGFLVTSGVTLVMSLLFAQYLLRPIKKLTEGVSDLADGNLDTAVHMDRKDEFGQLASNFNTMIRKLKAAHSETEDLTNQLRATVESYSKFVPHEFLRQLGYHRIVEVRLGDHIERKMTALFADIRSFTTLSEQMSPQETFDFINEYLGNVGPVITKHSGFIDSARPKTSIFKLGFAKTW